MENVNKLHMVESAKHFYVVSICVVVYYRVDFSVHLELFLFFLF